jgi:hypothetical protein
VWRRTMSSAVSAGSHAVEEQPRRVRRTPRMPLAPGPAQPRGRPWFRILKRTAAARTLPRA